MDSENLKDYYRMLKTTESCMIKTYLEMDKKPKPVKKDSSTDRELKKYKESLS